VIGSVGDRYTPQNTPPEELRKLHIARDIRLENLTPHPVELTEYSSGCRITSRGPVTDSGAGNTIERVTAED
jgi:hypothetical protein